MSLVELPNGSKLYVESRGLATGHAIVFVHGVGTDRRMWDPLFDVKPNELESKFWIILYNWAGSGRSPIMNTPPSIESHAQDLALLVRYLNLESPYIVGHSLGSFISAKYAVGDQGSISKLVLISSPLSPRPEPARAAQKKKEWPRLEKPSRSRPWLSPRYRLSLHGRSPDGYAANLEASSNFEEHIEVEKLEVPVLVINGGRDQMARDGSRLFQAIRGSKWEVVADVGHSVPIEAPDAVAKHLLAFL